MHSPDSFHFCPNCGTPLSLNLKSGAKLLSCQACGWIHYEDPKVACGGLLLREGSVLLVKRVMEPQSGAWSIPAGFMNAREHPEETVKREFFEETGLRVEVERLVEVSSGREHPRGSDILLVYLVRLLGGELIAGDDASDAAWFPLTQLPLLAFKSTHRVLAKLNESS